MGWYSTCEFGSGGVTTYGTVTSGPIVPAIHCAAPIESAVLLALDPVDAFVRDGPSAAVVQAQKGGRLRTKYIN